MKLLGNAKFPTPYLAKSKRRPGSKEKETTYSLYTSWLSADPNPNLNILLLHHQIRAEALPVSHGKTLFQFQHIHPLVPFLADRQQSVRFIRDIHLNLKIGQFVVGEKKEARQRSWAKAFTELAEIPEFKLEQISIHLKVWTPWGDSTHQSCSGDGEKEWVGFSAQDFKEVDAFGKTLDRFLEETGGRGKNLGLKQEKLWKWLGPI